MWPGRRVAPRRSGFLPVSLAVAGDSRRFQPLGRGKHRPGPRNRGTRRYRQRPGRNFHRRFSQCGKKSEGKSLCWLSGERNYTAWYGVAWCGIANRREENLIDDPAFTDPSWFQPSEGLPYLPPGIRRAALALTITSLDNFRSPLSPVLRRRRKAAPMTSGPCREAINPNYSASSEYSSRTLSDRCSRCFSWATSRNAS
jgi:hypothetical protein